MIARRLELDVLNAVATREVGAALGDLSAHFKGQPLARVLDHLEMRGQIDRFPGLVFSITPLGRSRLKGASGQ